MADAIKKVAPHAWEICVKQQVTEGITYGVSCAVVTVLLLLVSRRAFLWMKEQTKDGGDIMDHAAGPLPGLLMVVSLMAAFCFASNIPDYVLQVLNPEYYAIKTLLGK